MKAGEYRFVSDRSELTVAAQAPGHRFVAKASGLAGTLEISDDKVSALSVELPLAGLRAPDPLGQAQLVKFLQLDERPIARATIDVPWPLSGPAEGRRTARGRATFSIGARHARVEVEAVADSNGEASARFSLSFSDLGYVAPRLLFLRVADRLEFEVRARIERV